MSLVWCYQHDFGGRWRLRQGDDRGVPGGGLLARPVGAAIDHSAGRAGGLALLWSGAVCTARVWRLFKVSPLPSPFALGSPSPAGRALAGRDRLSEPLGQGRRGRRRVHRTVDLLPTPSLTGTGLVDLRPLCKHINKKCFGGVVGCCGSTDYTRSGNEHQRIGGPCQTFWVEYYW